MRRLLLALLSALALATGVVLIAQQPVKVVDSTGADVPVSTTTEVAHDAALGTLTNNKGLLMFCRAHSTSGGNTTASDYASLVLCDRLGRLYTITRLAASVNGGGLPGYYISTASNNSTSLSATESQLYSFSVINVTASFKYIRLYDSSSAPTCTSSTGIVYYSPIPGSTTNPVPLVWTAPAGKYFANGIGFCITGGSGVTDNTSTSAGDVVFNFDYK